MGAKLLGTFRSSSGDAIASPSITVYEAGTSTLASVYSASALVAGNALANPFVGDANGQWECFVAPGWYRVLGPGGYDEDYVRAAPLPQQSIDVRDYGASPSASAAANFAAIQAAIDAAPAGSTVFVPAGTYQIDGVLKDNGQDYVTITGEGQASKIVGVTNYQTIFTITGRTGWCIQDLWLYGPGNGRRVTVDQEGCGVMMVTCSYSSVLRCRIENCGLHDGTDPGIAAVYLREACTYCKVNDNLIIDCNSAVIEDAYVQTATPFGNEAMRNISQRCRAHYGADSRGFAGAVGSSMKICGNLIDGHATDSSTERYGIRVLDTRGAMVCDNTIRNVNTGIELYADCWRCTVSGNTITTPNRTTAYGGHGIHALVNPGATSRKPLGCTISGNTIDGAEDRGIYLQGGVGFDVSNNVIASAGGVGLEIAVDQVTASGNLIDSAGSHSIYVTGADANNVNLVGNLLIGDPADSGLTDDGIRVDATTTLGRLHAEGNFIRNAASSAGFKYGINRPSGSVSVSWGFNRYVNMATADVNPSTLTTASLYNARVERGCVINDAGGDFDTRIEGDTEQNLVFVDAGADRVGVGTGAPGNRFHVAASNAGEEVICQFENAGGGGVQFRLVTTGRIWALRQTTSGLAFRDTTGAVEPLLLAQGALGNALRVEAAGVAIGAAGSFGSGTKVVFIANASVVPSTDPTGGGIIYVEAGALKYRGSGGTVTILGPA